MRRSSLTGAWSVSCRYPVGGWPETVFNALIEEHDGAFTGATSELNLLRPSPGPLVTADNEGRRTGFVVRFNKLMNGTGGMDRVVIYDGVADADLRRVEGAWRIAGDWSGTFFMTRDNDGAEEAVGEDAEAKL